MRKDGAAPQKVPNRFRVVRRPRDNTSNLDVPASRSHGPLRPNEAAWIPAFEFETQRARLVIDDDQHRLIERQRRECGMDARMPFPRRNAAHIERERFAAASETHVSRFRCAHHRAKPRPMRLRIPRPRPPAQKPTQPRRSSSRSYGTCSYVKRTQFRIIILHRLPDVNKRTRDDIYQFLRIVPDLH
jgi:hypothetical protein